MYIIYMGGSYLSMCFATLIGTNQFSIGISEEKLRRTIYRRKTLEDLTLPTYQGSSAKEARLLLTQYEAGVR